MLFRSIFGAGKLPQLGEGVGKAIKGFKKSVHEAEAIEAEAQAQGQLTAQAPGQPVSAQPSGTAAAEPQVASVPPPSHA